VFRAVQLSAGLLALVCALGLSYFCDAADDARKVLADMKAKGEKPIPRSKLKKQLGL
jgi:hypothetical protein